VATALRITFLAPHLRIAGGVRAILTYADRLAAQGHEVTLVVPTGRQVTAWWRNARGAPVDWMPGLRARVVWVPGWSADVLPSGDAIVATAWQSAPVAADAPERCGAKFYLVQHYESLHHGDPTRVDATYRLPLAKIVISTWLRDVMRERFGCDAELLVTPVDRALFHRVAVTVTTSRPRVLMLHHTYPWKGVADGLQAVALVRPRVPGLRLVGFGVKPPRRPGLYDEFHANPPQAQLAALYSGCDIYLCPSWDEGLGMPAMEAMACGVALVTYDNGGCRDYARPEETALVAPSRDVGALAKHLARLAEDGALRGRLAAAGMACVHELDWDHAVTRLAHVLTRGPAGARGA
jgi:glycosyltransferase involved in cell wall biosynthesis